MPDSTLPPFEDLLGDVLRKTLRGTGLLPAEVAERAGLTVEALHLAVAGQVETEALDGLASILHLHAPGLHAHTSNSLRSHPEPVSHLTRFTAAYPVPGYEEMTVNSFVVTSPTSNEAIVIDGGPDTIPIVAFLKEHSLRVPHILLTHTHIDHVEDLDRLIEATDATVWVHRDEPFPEVSYADDGLKLELDGLSVQVLHTPGHSEGGITLRVDGLAQPLAFVGDALFTGSMGGAEQKHWRTARRSLNRILALPPETILCAGHGPLSTVELELAQNPFAHY